ncbi:nucleoside-diphosphate-sugar epimerase [Pseudopedobacter saltans DSM 12145]|uniref:Nucleoside-diphosphate-sugar epimerase n=1 Tax=Pseudopedobacter saltans (strain ATCC 51119 / DSM 12145 / JCM 21818 / CCUG 39354 / LMG 10337 / NBRC 100064 / NCIMB 13643) TaxID=762903 RepID=F0S9L1_PSESL|nr:NAD(P)H-binding protein [Pseudopedobacter saltans]ADY53564.1 nucleoside-diphosphate-sugar epimerase [Pseudopedobacter saltans DSM 12145]
MDSNVIVLGSNGLVGSLLLDILLKSHQYSYITVFVRKQLEIEHQKLNQIITDFKDLESLREHIHGDILFSCLGSTQKKTPNKEDYIFVDITIPSFFADMASRKGLKQIHLVSAVGASSASPLFYNKIKGQLEDFIKETEIPSINIYQPSLILGNRNEFRLGEKITSFLIKVIDPLLVGSFKKYRSTKALDIAKAMYNVSLEYKNGVYTYTSDKIKELA